MGKIRLTLACWDYDRTRALQEGRVEVEGVDLTYLPLRWKKRSGACCAMGNSMPPSCSTGSYLMARDKGAPRADCHTGISFKILSPFLYLYQHCFRH